MPALFQWNKMRYIVLSTISILQSSIRYMNTQFHIGIGSTLFLVSV